MNGLIEVATYDAAEGSLEKKPKEYQEFMYDTQTNGGILEGFAKTRELTAAIAEDVEEIKRQFNALIEIYDQFTGYNDTMTSIGNRMTDCSDRIKKFNDNVISVAEQSVEEAVNQDNSLMSFLEDIKEFIQPGSVNDSTASDAVFK